MNLEPTLFQTEIRLRELRADAARRHLAALATCCQPSWWAARWHAARAAVSARRTPTTCCA